MSDEFEEIKKRLKAFSYVGIDAWRRSEDMEWLVAEVQYLRKKAGLPAFPAVVDPPIDLDGHPNDVRDELESRQEAATWGPALLAPHVAELMKLVTTYSDQAAIDALEAIREWFWSHPLESKSRGRP